MNKISYISDNKTIEKDTDDRLYRIRRNENIYNYLKSKNFYDFIEPLEVSEKYEIFPNIKDEFVIDKDKAEELVYKLSLLHTKTTSYNEINQEKIDEYYNYLKNKITTTKIYYYDLQDHIESKIFFSPAEQLLMNNISDIHKLINYSEKSLEEWYKVKKTSHKERVAQLHNNLKLTNFIKSEKTYFINWDKSIKDLVIYDFLIFYKNEFFNLEMSSLFSIYQTKYAYTIDEHLLFKTLLSLPEKVTLKKTNYINTIEVNKIIKYVKKTKIFISEYYKEYQNTN